MNVQQWMDQHIPDLSGKRILITGANSGLGFETTRLLASRNAEIIMACRNQSKAEAAKANILEQHPPADLTIMNLNLASLKSVEMFAEAFKSEYQSLDILINNAGIMAPPLQRTEEGFEMQFGTNHLGHFALTGLLLDRILATPDSRIVNLGSAAHRFGKMHFDDLQWHQRYSRWPAYGQSKLANLLFTYELARKLEQAEAQTITAAAHPGYAATNLQFLGPNSDDSKLKGFFLELGNRLFAQSAEMGALPTVYAAAAKDVRNGDYFGPDGWMERAGWPTQVSSNARSHDRQDAQRLWQESVRLTAVDFHQLESQQERAKAVGE